MDTMTYCEFLLKFARHSNWKSLSPCHVLLCKFYSNLLVTSKKILENPQLVVDYNIHQEYALKALCYLT